MQCLEFYNQASDWVDGQHPTEAADHLAACAACRGLVADLEAIRVAGAQWAAETDVEPPARVWTSLRAQLEAEGIIREHAGRSWLAALWTWAPRPVLAGAYLSLVIVVGFYFGTQSSFNVSTAPTAETAIPATAPLRIPAVTQVAVSSMHEHNPDVTAHYQRSLAIVDNSIRLCEKTLREEPQNDLAREYLVSAYQQKAELLAAMAERVATGD